MTDRTTPEAALLAEALEAATCGDEHHTPGFSQRILAHPRLAAVIARGLAPDGLREALERLMEHHAGVACVEDGRYWHSACQAAHDAAEQALIDAASAAATTSDAERAAFKGREYDRVRDLQDAVLARQQDEPADPSTRTEG